MNQLTIKRLGLQPYETVWQQMKDFTDTRTSATADEIWLVEHPSVFTLGQAGKAVHILEDIGIPIVNSDRGGQVTYHGPGQLVAYLLIDLRRKKIGVRDLVTGIEESVISLLGALGIESAAKKDAPGVYVDGRKVAALGLRVRRGCSYHGLSLNVDLDLTPFYAINPCGYQGLEVTRLKDLGIGDNLSELAPKLIDEIQAHFQYDNVRWQEARNEAQ